MRLLPKILIENKAMQAVVNKPNTKFRSKVTGNVISYEMDIE
jgi:hypothetical protein